MKFLGKALFGAVMLAGTSIALSSPASAYVDVGISFGWGAPIYGFDPCDYYDYYDEPPPWGLPDDFCDYPVYFEPIFIDGYWYRGPIYYRWTHGRRLFWVNGAWREDRWRGSRPSHITWNDRGTHVRGFRPGIGFHGGGRDWRDGAGNRRGQGNDHPNRGPWTGGGDHPWSGPGGNDHPRNGGGGEGGHRDGGGSHWGGERGGFGDRGSFGGQGDRGSFGGDRGGGHGEFHGGSNGNFGGHRH
jgi:hypothetical protein